MATTTTKSNITTRRRLKRKRLQFKIAFDFFLRTITNLFLITILSIFIIDTLPFGHEGPIQFTIIKRWQSFLTQHVVYKIGLWQHIWALFAPEPLLTRVRLSADLIYYRHNTTTTTNNNNTTTTITRQWHSLNFSDMSLYEWKRHNRMISYISEIQMEEHRKRKVYVPLLQNYLAEMQFYQQEEQQQHKQQPQKPDKITLYRHEQFVKPPPSPPPKEEDTKDDNDDNDKQKSIIEMILGPPLIKRYKQEQRFVMGSWERKT